MVRFGGIFGSLQHIYGLVHECRGTFGYVVVLRDCHETRARL